MQIILRVALIVWLVAAIFTGEPAAVFLYLFFVLFMIPFGLWPAPGSMGPFRAKAWAFDHDMLLLYGGHAKEKLIAVFRLDSEPKLILVSDQELMLMGQRIRFHTRHAPALFEEIRAGLDGIRERRSS